MLDKYLSCVILEEFSDEKWIPQLAGHPQVFAATHHRVRLAAFGGSGDGFGAEVGLLATGNGNQSDNVKL